MIDELSALKRIRERFGNVSKDVLVGIGDDAAAVKIHPEKLLLATTDSQVENIHFTKKLISPENLARRAVAISASDIGAMGGVPKFFLATLGLSKEQDRDFIEKLMDGFQRAEDEFEIRLIGGNLSASDELFLDITVLGEVEPDFVVKRSGAEPGDAVYVSGTVGDSALGLRILQNTGATGPLRPLDKLRAQDTASTPPRAGLVEPLRTSLPSFGEKDGYLISRYITPEPRLILGRELARSGFATSMIDVSDGLLLDLERITVEYGVGAEILIDRIPISPYYRERISDFVKDPYELALSGGEDYELIFTSPREKREGVERLSGRHGLKITEIGHITPEPSLRVLGSGGKEIKVMDKGFIHF